jgi:hypothetical protein
MLAHQPSDILYCIIAYLAYTPDTARLGRVCKRVDSFPHWYERSGHLQPHNEYMIKPHEVAYFTDGVEREVFEYRHAFWSHYRSAGFISTWREWHSSAIVYQQLAEKDGEEDIGLGFDIESGKATELTRVHGTKITIVRGNQSGTHSLYIGTLDRQSAAIQIHSKSTFRVTDRKIFELFHYMPNGRVDSTHFLHQSNGRGVTVYCADNDSYFPVDPADLPDLFEFDWGIFQP